MGRLNLKFTDTKYSDQELCESISSILNGNLLLALSTVSDNKSYVNTSYFAFDESLELFFLSEPATQHCRNISINSSAAVAVYDSSQPWDYPKRGLQLFGTAKIVEGNDLEKGFDCYAARFPGLLTWARTLDEMNNNLNSRFYKVSIDWIKLFDEPKFGIENYITLQMKK